MGWTFHNCYVADILLGQVKIPSVPWFSKNQVVCLMTAILAAERNKSFALSASTRLSDQIPVGQDSKFVLYAYQVIYSN